MTKTEYDALTETEKDNIEITDVPSEVLRKWIGEIDDLGPNGHRENEDSDDTWEWRFVYMKELMRRGEW